MSKPQQGSPRPHARPAPPPRRARSGRASPPHSPSHAGAATNAPRSTHLRQTATPPPGTSPQLQPAPQPVPEDPMNRVLPSMLAPSPSQHLESDFQPFGNPKSDSALPKRALGEESRRSSPDVYVTSESATPSRSMSDPGPTSGKP